MPEKEKGYSFRSVKEKILPLFPDWKILLGRGVLASTLVLSGCQGKPEAGINKLASPAVVKATGEYMIDLLDQQVAEKQTNGVNTALNKILNPKLLKKNKIYQETLTKEDIDRGRELARNDFLSKMPFGGQPLQENFYLQSKVGIGKLGASVTTGFSNSELVSASLTTDLLTSGKIPELDKYLQIVKKQGPKVSQKTLQDIVTNFTNVKDISLKQSFADGEGRPNRMQLLEGSGKLASGENVNIRFFVGTGYCNFELQTWFGNRTENKGTNLPR